MDVTLYQVMIVPLIIGLVEVVKRLEVVPDKYMPIIALCLGLGGGALLYSGDWVQAVVVGLALGLSAVGLYSGAKNVTEGIRGD